MTGLQKIAAMKTYNIVPVEQSARTVGEAAGRGFQPGLLSKIKGNKYARAAAILAALGAAGGAGYAVGRQK